jgi:hypothetical protein
VQGLRSRAWIKSTFFRFFLLVKMSNVLWIAVGDAMCCDSFPCQILCDLLGAKNLLIWAVDLGGSLPFPALLHSSPLHSIVWGGRVVHSVGVNGARVALTWWQI